MSVYVLTVAALVMQCQTAETKGNVWANLDVQMYGFIKVDASYDASETTPGNFVKWVKSETEGTISSSSTQSKKNDDEFNLTGNQTRFGFIFTGPETEDKKVSGRMEFDFYGSASAENKSALLVRHAYIELEYKKKNVSLLAGQTFDVVSPLAPQTVSGRRFLVRQSGRDATCER